MRLELKPREHVLKLTVALNPPHGKKNSANVLSNFTAEKLRSALVDLVGNEADKSVSVDVDVSNFYDWAVAQPKGKTYLKSGPYSCWFAVIHVESKDKATCDKYLKKLNGAETILLNFFKAKLSCVYVLWEKKFMVTTRFFTTLHFTYCMFLHTNFPHVCETNKQEIKDQWQKMFFETNSSMLYVLRCLT